MYIRKSKSGTYYIDLDLVKFYNIHLFNIDLKLKSFLLYLTYNERHYNTDIKSIMKLEKKIIDFINRRKELLDLNIRFFHLQFRLEEFGIFQNREFFEIKEAQDTISKQLKLDNKIRLERKMDSFSGISIISGKTIYRKELLKIIL